MNPVGGVRFGRHRPRRPGWTCHGCDQAFPCPQGRLELTRRYGRGELGQVVYLLLEAAVADLPEASLAGLWDRFVVWTRPPAPVEQPEAFRALSHRAGERSCLGQLFPPPPG